MNQLGAEGLIDSLSTYHHDDWGSTRTTWGNQGRSHISSVVNSQHSQMEVNLYAEEVLADGSHWLVEVRRRKIKFETVLLLDLQHQLVAYLSQVIQEAA